MIYVSQGHERGVGLEVFLKSIVCLNKELLKEIVLFANLDTVIITLESCHFKYQIVKNSIIIGPTKLNCVFTNKDSNSQTISTLLEILKIIKPSDLLVTLPSSKDQIIFQNKQFNGYTEFLRNYYKKSISMNFVSNCDNVLLLTDHIAIESVPIVLCRSFITNTISCSIDNFPKYIDHVIVSGLNPHAGESGLISKDDERIFQAIEELKIKYPKIEFTGPLPSDTIHLNRNREDNELVVYCYHDQGLNPFKLQNGLIGINLSLGLDFLRVSVDHGTAFNLFGKNLANYQGMLFLLNEIKNWQKKSPA